MGASCFRGKGIQERDEAGQPAGGTAVGRRGRWVGQMGRSPSPGLGSSEASGELQVGNGGGWRLGRVKGVAWRYREWRANMAHLL